MQYHYVTENSNQHKYIVKQQNDITIVLNRHNTLTFPRHNTDSGEVTSGPTRHLTHGDSPFWLVVPRRTWEALACVTHASLCIHAYIYICTYTCIYIDVYIYIYIYIYTNTYIREREIFICVYKHMYIDRYILCIHTYTCKLSSEYYFDYGE